MPKRVYITSTEAERLRQQQAQMTWFVPTEATLSLRSRLKRAWNWPRVVWRLRYRSKLPWRVAFRACHLWVWDYEYWIRDEHAKG